MNAVQNSAEETKNFTSREFKIRDEHLNEIQQTFKAQIQEQNEKLELELERRDEKIEILEEKHLNLD